MSALQKLLIALADEMKANTLRPCELTRLAHSLDGINELYHEDLILSAFGVKKEEEPDA
jgi:hypothetical protein